MVAPHTLFHATTTRLKAAKRTSATARFLRAVIEEAGAARVVGEALGVVPDYVRPNYVRLALPDLKFRNGKSLMG